MSEQNQGITKDYPIFKLNFPEHCTTPESCSASDLSLKFIEIKTYTESYILQYQCYNKAIIIDKFVGTEIAPECKTKKYPLDAFLVTKTGIGSDIETYLEEEMPASDFCHDKHVSVECGKMAYAFPYTDQINGYKLLPITDENREEIYTEFNKEGFIYERSQIIINNILNEHNIEKEAVSEPDLGDTAAEAQIEVHAAPQTLGEYISSLVMSGIDCVMDPIDCLNL